MTTEPTIQALIDLTEAVSKHAGIELLDGPLKQPLAEALDVIRMCVGFGEALEITANVIDATSDEHAD